MRILVAMLMLVFAAGALIAVRSYFIGTLVEWRSVREESDCEVGNSGYILAAKGKIVFLNYPTAYDPRRDKSYERTELVMRRITARTTEHMARPGILGFARLVDRSGPSSQPGGLPKTVWVIPLHGISFAGASGIGAWIALHGLVRWLRSRRRGFSPQFN
jgi:hypothetical protein